MALQPRYTVRPVKYAKRFGNFMVRDLKDHCAVGCFDTEQQALDEAARLNAERERRIMYGRNP